MKIDYCDEYNKAIIEVSKEELGLILGERLGDKYGNGGKPFSKRLEGTEYNLNILRESQFCNKVSHENKKQVVKYLRSMADDIERKIQFFIPEISQDK